MLVIIGLLFAMFQVPAAAPVRPGFSGIVVRQDTGELLAKASVVLTAENDARTLQSVTSDAGGKFAFDDVPAGRYRIAATRTGYVRAEYGDREGRVRWGK